MCKNCGFFNKSIFLGQCKFRCHILYLHMWLLWKVCSDGRSELAWYLTSYNKCGINGKNAICKVCHTSFKFSSSTSTLHYHMHNAHNQKAGTSVHESKKLFDLQYWQVRENQSDWSFNFDILFRTSWSGSWSISKLISDKDELRPRISRNIF